MKGLTKEEVLFRQKQGKNVLVKQKKPSFIKKFLNSMKDPLILILLASAILSIFADRDDIVEAIIIFVVVILNGLLGAIQEANAEKSLEALKRMLTPFVKVLRDEAFVTVEASDVVVDDIVYLEAGDYVPADGVIKSFNNLSIDESQLTGESIDVVKNIKDPVFMSSYVKTGNAYMQVEKIGMRTEIGKIASMLTSKKNVKTPLQKRLNEIGEIISVSAIIICIVVFVIELLSFVEPLLAFKTAIALAVAAIPEGLSTVVVIVLSVGVTRMAKKKAIVKRLPSVETLGCTNVICSDKTGTLTENKMTISEIFTDKSFNDLNLIGFKEKEMLSLVELCTNATFDEKRIGDALELAIIECNQLFGINKNDLRKYYPRIEEIPFSSDRKMMSVLVEYQNKLLIITKGAPEVVLGKCKMSFYDRSLVLSMTKKMAEKALRVIAVAITETKEKRIKEYDLKFVGLIGMIDREKEGVKEAISIAKKAGVDTVMITGDSLDTALAIAKNLDLIASNSEGISKQDLDKLSDKELTNRIAHYKVFARVSPIDKVRIVKAYKALNMIVAMTGDGVNDSPALKEADIGIAMGSGTEVAKEASDMVLVDDNFNSIVKAIEEGRGIYKNIKKSICYLLSSNIGEVLTIFIASLIGLITRQNYLIPLFPIHLLWVNLITDSLPAFALGVDDNKHEVMNELPRKKNESFFANKIAYDIVFQGIYICFITLIAFYIGLRIENKTGVTYLSQTMAFLTLSLSQLFHAFNMKSNHSVFSKQVSINKYLFVAFICGVSLQLMILYVPSLASLFKLVPLSPICLFITVILSFSIVIQMEISKLIKKRKMSNK